MFSIPSQVANSAISLIKYMVGLKMQERIHDLILSNFVLPYWKIEHAPLPQRDGDVVIKVTDEQHLDVRRIEYLAQSRLAQRIEWSGYGQRMEYLPDLSRCRNVFSHPDTDTLGYAYDDGHLVCHIRGGDALDGRHGGYTLLPVDFYRDIADKLGLRPVFVGQLADNPYIDALRSALPDAVYVPQGDIPWDFQTVRKSRNILLSVSTFCWTAAWLSEARRIILPVYGLFNPRQFPRNDLLPLADGRYTFYQFPVHWAVPVDRVLDAHKAIIGQWEVSPPASFVHA